MRLLSLPIVALFAFGCLPAAPGILEGDGRRAEGEGEAGEGEAGEGEGEPEGGEGEGEGGPGPGITLAPGSGCACDADCAGSTGHEGACVLGVCMQLPSAPCSAAGSRTECDAGFQCWGVDGIDGGVCWPDCAAFDCEGTCDADGSCAPSAATAGCDNTCSDHCAGGPAPGGDPGDCPPNSSPGEGDGCYCNEGFVVVNNACVHACETNAECTGGQVCTDFECKAPPCTANSCDDGFRCGSGGACVLDIGSPPAGTPPSSCSPAVPSFACTGGESNCGTVVAFTPVEGDGYWNYPLNGETEARQYRSFARRDVLSLVKYAAASTRCASANWPFGNGEPIALGDMSEANGAIPGTSDGEPGHPEGTHEEGRDMDIGYFQIAAVDNKLRPVCAHTSGGSDQYHCVSDPTDLDVWRTAAFIAELHDSPQLRVVGVDGRVGPLIESAVEQLCAGGWINGLACTQGLSLAYETVDEGQGWFRFHHHHFHISLMSRPEAGLALPIVGPRSRRMCLDEGCQVVVDVAHDPRRRIYTEGQSLLNPLKRAP
ncbi:MAG: hypothetical protein Q8O67_13210 [Deltaproteobacteria bacterium]|nr:hypothetical protein [Deltaproteobacteria bacterium]